jgi:hypothetical protein
MSVFGVTRIIGIDEITPEARINDESKWCKNGLRGTQNILF